MTDDIELEQAFSGFVVRANDEADMQHRWWFDTTESDRAVFCAEVIEYDPDEFDVTVDGRHYVPSDEMSVPDRIRDVLDDHGYESVYDTSGVQL